jgi:RNA polymerase sigma-70 factor (ECF subfamily)
MLPARTQAEPTVSDEVLAARARSGARAAFATLVERYQDRVYRLTLRLSHNSSDAEEITQEALLLAHRSISSFQGQSRFWTWLYRIAVNCALMQRRSARRHPVQSLEVTGPSGERIERSIAEPLEGADELVHRKMLAQRVRQALAGLDESQRAAVVLRDLEGLSSEDAADVLGVSADVVRQRAHRARLRLREQLSDLLRLRAGDG